jgi:TetR/AcrR family transcriptional regulator of autoinduction and epiphytic fitness
MQEERDTPDHGRAARPYRSPRRAEQARQTRQRILAAARAEFLASGYSGTTMRQIAAAADVSVATLEIAFQAKSRLLARVIDVAIAGDDEPVAVLDRASVAEAAAAVPLRDFLARVAEILADGQQRSARLVMVAFDAAASDPGLRPLAEDRLAQRVRTAEWITDGMLARGSLRSGIDRQHAVDTVWLLMDPVVFCRLTEDRAWSTEMYRRWFADSAERLVLSTAEP